MSHSGLRRNREEDHGGAGGDDRRGSPQAKRLRGCCSCSCCQERKDFYESQIEILKKEMECMSKGFMEERKILQKEMQEFYQSSQLQLHELITEQGRRMQECHNNSRLIWEQLNNQLSKIEKSGDHVQQSSNPRTCSDDGELRKYRMKFENKCCDPEYSRQDIMADDAHPLKVAIYDCDNRIIREGPLSSIQVKVVVLHGEFNNDHKEHWKREYFREKMISSRPGKPPLLSEDLYPRLEGGMVNIYGVKFQDNSSFVPSKRFRLGVMAADDSMSKKIQEGISESFAVRDRRGLSTKKNTYPSSHDPVYKLSGIAMKGDRHKLLERHGIKKVEDLLRLYCKNPEGLREIFGKISDHDWDKIINHAHKCNQVAQRYSSSIQEKNVPREHEPFSKTNDSSYLKGPCSMQPSPTPHSRFPLPPSEQIDAQVHHQQFSSSYNGLSSDKSSENALQASCSMLEAPGTFMRTDQHVTPYGELGGIQVTGQQVACIGRRSLGRLLSSATVGRGDFFARLQIHLLAGAASDPPSSDGRSGGGRAGDLRSSAVDRVASGSFSSGGAMEKVWWPAEFLVQVRVFSGGGAPWSFAVADQLRSLPRISGSAGSVFPLPDLAWRRIWVDKFDAEDGGASGGAGGAGWSFSGVQVLKTSRPLGGGFPSKVSRKLWRRRVFDTAASAATSTQKDLCFSSFLVLIFSVFLL